MKLRKRLKTILAETMAALLCATMVDITAFAHEEDGTIENNVIVSEETEAADEAEAQDSCDVSEYLEATEQAGEEEEQDSINLGELSDDKEEEAPKKDENDEGISDEENGAEESADEENEAGESVDEGDELLDDYSEDEVVGDGVAWEYGDGNTVVIDGEFSAHVYYELMDDGELFIFRGGTTYENINNDKLATIGEYASFVKRVYFEDKSIDNGKVTNDFFRYFVNLESVRIPSTVTEINGLFSNCENLQSVELPTTLKTIGANTFSGCISLKSFVIPSSVTSIGANAFSGCSNLNKLQIPSAVSTIGDSAFSGCAFSTAGNSSTYDINCKWTTSIPAYAFSGCDSLTKIVVYSGITSIGNSAFSGCTNLNSVTLPSSVTSIGDSVFKNCADLSTITLPSNIKRISDSLFKGCSKLTSINLPYSVTSIDSQAFSGCSSLSSIIIPKNVTEISKSAFNGCSGIESAGPIGEGYDYEFGWTSEIPAYAFKGCSSLSTITIPTDVTRIGAGAFDGCSNLSSITIPPKVTKIGSEAFFGCGNLSSITIPSSVTEISDNTFYGCSNLSKIWIPTSVRSIGKNAFNGCSSLSTITIPTGVGLIDSGTFANCSSLSTITIPTRVKVIADGAFKGCSNLSSITIPSSVSNICSYAFSGCSNLSSITIPSTVNEIGSYAFSGCSNLNDITIPRAGTIIGYKAFKECPGVTIGNKGTGSKFEYNTITEMVYYMDYYGIGNLCLNTDIECGAFEDNTSIRNVVILDGVLNIGNEAFSGCSNLSSIEIPEGVTSIGDSAFSNCSSLSSIKIPKGVTSIGDDAFYGCNDISLLVIAGSNAEIYAQKNNIKYAYWAKCIVHSVGVSLDGNVHVNIMYTAEGSLASDSTAYVLISDKKVSLSNAVSNGDGTYTISAEVAPKDYRKDVQICFGDSKGRCDGIYLVGNDEMLKVSDSVVHCSVSEYFNIILNGDYPESTKVLVQKAMEYCECASVYFGTMSGTDYSEGDNLEQYAVSSYASSVTGTSSGAEYIGSSLVLDGTIAIRHYFTINNAQNVTITTDYRTSALHKVADNLYYIEIANISAANFDKKYETVLSCNGSKITVNYSVMSYAHEIGRNMTDSNIRNLCASLYMYMNAAKEYMKNN